MRVVLLVGSYLWLGALAVLCCVVSGSSVSGPARSIYDENPEPVTVLLAVLGAACLVVTASLLWRCTHRSPRPGVAGLVAAGGAGVVALLGVFTVGPFILPLAALLFVVALPMDRLEASAAEGVRRQPAGGASGSSV